MHNTAPGADASSNSGDDLIRPVNMQLNDDTLLEEIAFTEQVDDQSNLALLDQCIVLASWYDERVCGVSRGGNLTA